MIKNIVGLRSSINSKGSRGSGSSSILGPPAEKCKMKARCWRDHKDHTFFYIKRIRVNKAIIWPRNFGKFWTLYCLKSFTHNIKTVTLLYMKMFEILIMHPLLPWEYQLIRWNRDFLYFSIIFGTSGGYLNTAPCQDHHKTFPKSRLHAA